MKQLIRHTVTSFALGVACLLGAAQAQGASWVIKAHIPFEFNVGNKAFPAGNYSITRPLQNFLALRDEQGHTIATAFTYVDQFSSGPAATKLRFRSSGGQHTLLEVWQAQESPAGQRLYESKFRVMTAKRQTVDSTVDAADSACGTKP